MNELTDVGELHESDSVDTRPIVLEIMPKLYDYIVAAELSKTPYTAPPAINRTKNYLYFSEETLGHTRTS